MTNPPKSNVRSALRLGGGFAIPAQAGIQFLLTPKSSARSASRLSSGFVIPEQARMQFILK